MNELKTEIFDTDMLVHIAMLKYYFANNDFSSCPYTHFENTVRDPYFEENYDTWEMGWSDENSLCGKCMEFVGLDEWMIIDCPCNNEHFGELRDREEKVLLITEQLLEQMELN